MFKDIEGYEGLYQINQLGEVKSLDRIDSGGRKWKGRVLKNRRSKNGYMSVSLCKDKKNKSFSVHTLVAKAFIPNPNNYKEINHKDENPSNNNVDNLEWCDHKYNINYGTCIQRMSQSNTNNPLISKKVYQYTINGVFIAEYPSTREAARQTGFSKTGISEACRGNFEQLNGYIWKYN